MIDFIEKQIVNIMFMCVLYMHLLSRLDADLISVEDSRYLVL